MLGVPVPGKSREFRPKRLLGQFGKMEQKTGREFTPKKLFEKCLDRIVRAIGFAASVCHCLPARSGRDFAEREMRRQSRRTGRRRVIAVARIRLQRGSHKIGKSFACAGFARLPGGRQSFRPVGIMRVQFPVAQAFAFGLFLKRRDAFRRAHGFRRNEVFHDGARKRRINLIKYAVGRAHVFRLAKQAAAETAERDVGFVKLCFQPLLERDCPRLIAAGEVNGACAGLLDNALQFRFAIATPKHERAAATCEIARKCSEAFIQPPARRAAHLPLFG